MLEGTVEHQELPEQSGMVGSARNMRFGGRGNARRIEPPGARQRRAPRNRPRIARKRSAQPLGDRSYEALLRPIKYVVGQVPAHRALEHDLALAALYPEVLG